MEFGDVNVHLNDLQSLEPGCWITDAVIEFFYEWLESTKYKDSIQSKNTFGLLRPAIVQWLAHSPPQSLPESALPLQSLSKNLVFIPINDNTALNNVGGTHWSLAVYSRPNHTLYYYDSLGNYNLKTAQRNCSNLAYYLSLNESKKHPQGNIACWT